VVAISQYFHLDQVKGWICCDNIAALNQSSKNRKRVSARIKYSDLHCVIQSLKCSVTKVFKYDHVKAHQDGAKSWLLLRLEEQLNVICDDLANGAVMGYLSHSMPVIRKLQCCSCCH
jgi:hypothetical protein